MALVSINLPFKTKLKKLRKQNVNSVPKFVEPKMILKSPSTHMQIAHSITVLSIHRMR